MPNSPSLFDDKQAGNTTPNNNVKANLEGLELSDIFWQTPQSLEPNPLNDVFDAMKDSRYLEALTLDIAQHGILNPLIATQSGLLIEGHSRLMAAKTLQLPQVPVRLILSNLSDQELKERLYLGNLHRFEISKDLRTKMYADLYPHIFYDPHNPIPEAMAKAMGLSLTQARNEKQLLLLAISLKEERGDTTALGVHDINLARKAMNQARREKERLKRMRWQSVDQLPSQPFANSSPMPLLLSHEEPSPQDSDPDLLQEYKLLSQGSRSYAIYTKNDQLIAQLDPQTFKDLDQMDTFARSLILTFHHLRHQSK